MRQHYFLKAFATDGTNTPNIPNAADPSGFVSWAEGWTFDYQRDLLTDPAAKSPTYTNFNNFGFSITGALQDWQQNASPEFITSSDNGGSAFSYRLWAIVRYSGSGNPPYTLYMNTLDNNTNTPPGTGWIDIGNGIKSNYGKLIGVRALTSTTTYTPTTGTDHIIFEGVGGGAGAGGAPTNVAGNCAVGIAGNSGSYMKVLITSNFAGLVTIGAKGLGGNGVDGTGGGATTLGGIVSIPGGGHGSAGTSQVGSAAGGNGNIAGTGTFIGTGLVIENEGNGLATPSFGFATGQVQLGGNGGPSKFGAGAGGQQANLTGNNASNAGSGGGGVCGNGNTLVLLGGDGAPGKAIIWEYSGI